MADDQTPDTAVAETPETDVVDEARGEQTVKVEDAGPALKRLTIELPESRIKEKIEATFSTLSSDALLPGFRKGRAPAG